MTVTQRVGPAPLSPEDAARVSLVLLRDIGSPDPVVRPAEWRLPLSEMRLLR